MMLKLYRGNYMTIVKVLLALLAVATIVFELYKNWDNLGFIIKIWKRFRLMMFFECFGMLVFVVVGFLLLNSYIPILSWGWSNLIYSGGGNILLSPVIDSVKDGEVVFTAIGTIFLVALLFGLPFMAHYEEVAFRSYSSSRDWLYVIIQSLKFGFIHLLVGVPISIGLLLSVVGLFYALKYINAYIKATDQGLGPEDSNEEALLNCTAYHTMYNSILILVLIAVVWMT